MTDGMKKLKWAAAEVAAFAKGWFGLDRPHLYRPEAHYMRGPGPKWRALHGEPRRVVMLASRQSDRRARGSLAP